MRKVLLLATLAVLVSGCISYRGGTLSAGDFGGNDREFGRFTSGVSSGADPAPSITGSESVPLR